MKKGEDMSPRPLEKSTWGRGKVPEHLWTSEECFRSGEETSEVNVWGLRGHAEDLVFVLSEVEAMAGTGSD